MNRYVYIIPIVAAVSCWRLWADVRRKKNIRSLLAARPHFSDEEFGRHYFSEELAPVAARARALLHRHLPYDIAGLHPDDTFIEELKIKTFRRTALIEYLMDVEEEFEVDLGPDQEKRITSLAEVVAAVSRALDEKNEKKQG